mmetsp:Transcript_5644/g.8395  ORF Transcript_5644/g.8395 Transcript_5644/m.8395 type:complete len:143 (+) Transcript_5644:739-1167(+)
MDGESLFWLLLCLVGSAAGFYFGKRSEKPNLQGGAYSGIEFESEEKDLYSTQSGDVEYFKKELERERNTKKRMADEYEQEIAYLKDLLNKMQTKSKESMKRQEETQELFEEMNTEMGPLVSVVEGSAEELDEEIDREISMDT